MLNLLRKAQQAASQLGNKLNGESLELSVAQLKAKIPELKVFSDEIIPIQLYRYDGNVYGGTFRVYLNLDAQPQLYDAALQPVEEKVEFKQWTIEGFQGTALIVVGEQQFLIKLPIATDEPLKKSNGEGLPDLDLLESLPQPGALAFSALEKKKSYTLLERWGEFCQVEDEEGNLYKVREASALAELVEEKGGEDALPIRFEIYDWENAQIEGKQYKIPLIKSSDEADFSDLL